MDGWNTFSFPFGTAYFQVRLLLVSGSVYPNCWQSVCEFGLSWQRAVNHWGKILLGAAVMLFFSLVAMRIYLNQVFESWNKRVADFFSKSSGLLTNLSFRYVFGSRMQSVRESQLLNLHAWLEFWVGGRLVDARYVLSWVVLSTVKLFVAGHVVCLKPSLGTLWFEAM